VERREGEKGEVDSGWNTKKDVETNNPKKLGIGRTGG
jgi:hypothetical protein